LICQCRPFSQSTVNSRTFRSKPEHNIISPVNAIWEDRLHPLQNWVRYYRRRRYNDLRDKCAHAVIGKLVLYKRWALRHHRHIWFGSADCPVVQQSRCKRICFPKLCRNTFNIRTPNILSTVYAFTPYEKRTVASGKKPSPLLDAEASLVHMATIQGAKDDLGSSGLRRLRWRHTQKPSKCL